MEVDKQEMKSESEIWADKNLNFKYLRVTLTINLSLKKHFEERLNKDEISMRYTKSFFIINLVVL